MFQWVYALARNILSCSRSGSTNSRKAVSQGTVRFKFKWGTYVCVFLGFRVTEFRSSIIPDWHRLGSEVFTAAMPASASDSWDRRIGDVCSLGHQMSVGFLQREIYSAASVSIACPVALSTVFEAFLKKKLKLEETFSTCILVYIFSPLITLSHDPPSFSSSSESYGWLSLEAKPLKKKEDKNDF